MAEEQEQTESETQETQQSQESTIDYSWAPEAFVKDGNLDTENFRKSYDEAVAFKAQEDERKASLPSDPDQYELRVPELTLPEGLEIPVGEDGQPMKVEFDADDPEVPALRQLAMDLGLDQSGMDKILHLWAVKEIRAEAAIRKEASEEVAKLGPNAQSRTAEIQRQLGARLPKEMADAIADGITSADALRGLERLMSSGTRSTTTPPATPDLSSMTPLERLEFASAQKKSA